MAKHNVLGKSGEAIAENYLRDKGYQILEKNWRYKRIEIDIIAEIGDFIVFIEVKTRSSEQWGDPEEAVNSNKINNMVKAADHYIQNKNVENNVRFDVISIILNQNKTEVTHFDDAFLAPLN